MGLELRRGCGARPRQKTSGNQDRADHIGLQRNLENFKNDVYDKVGQ